jgi:outer membrane protein TolC
MLLSRWCIPLLTLTVPALFAADDAVPGPTAAPELRASPPPLSEDKTNSQVDAPVPQQVSLTTDPKDANVPPPRALNEPVPQKPSAVDYFGKGTRAVVVPLQQAIRQALKNNLDAKIDEIGISLENARVQNAYGEFDPVFSFSVQRQRLKTPDATDNIRNADSLLRLQDVALATQVVNSGIDAFNSTQQGVANFLAEIDRRIQAVSNQGVLNFQLPSLNYQPQLAQRIEPPTFSSDIVTFTQNVDSAEAGIRARTPLGTIFGVTVRGNKTQLSFVGDTRDVLPTYGASATFEFRQPLLKDGGTNANLADLRISKKNREAQELTWKFRIEVALQNVVANYYDMVSAFSDLENKSDAINSALKLLVFSHRREQLGFFSPYEVGQAKVQLLSDRANLYRAKTFLLDRQVLLKRQTLPEFDSRDSTVYLPEVIEPLPVPKLDIDALLKKAFSKRTDYKALIVNADSENVRLKFAQNQAYPQLDVVGSYGWTGLDRSFSDAADRMAEGEAPQWQLGINGSVPLGGIQGRAQIDAAKARKAQAIVRIKQAELEIGLSVRRSVDTIRNNQQALAAAKATSDAAKELVNVGLVRMEAGQLSSFELIDQQRRLYEARSVELQYQAALNKAITELWLATGTVLENLGVIYEDTVDERNLWERVTKAPPLAKPYLEKDGKPAPQPKSPQPAPSKKSAPQSGAAAPKEPSSSIIRPAQFAPRKPFWQKKAE